MKRTEKPNKDPTLTRDKKKSHLFIFLLINVIVTPISLTWLFSTYIEVMVAIFFAAEWLLLFVISVYSIATTGDVTSTVRYGRDIVSKYEASPLFRYMTKRFGFWVSIPVEVAFEITVILLVIPFYLVNSFDLVITLVGFSMVTVYHFWGWVSNCRYAIVKHPVSQNTLKKL